LLLLTNNPPGFIDTEPLNTWVLESKDPNRVEPVTKSTLDVIVCTTNVCAVKLPATVNVFAKDAVAAETAFDADCAKATNDAVAANDAEAIEPEMEMPPEAVIPPLIFTLPDTVSEPVTTGKYEIIIIYFLVLAAMISTTYKCFFICLSFKFKFFTYI
jgi:hypothetical protein